MAKELLGRQWITEFVLWMWQGDGTCRIYWIRYDMDVSHTYKDRPTSKTFYVVR